MPLKSDVVHCLLEKIGLLVRQCDAFYPYNLKQNQAAPVADNEANKSYLWNCE